MELNIELSGFFEELKDYREILTNPESKSLKSLVEEKRKSNTPSDFPFLELFFPTKSDEELKKEIIDDKREKLVRKAGIYKEKIYRLTGRKNYPKHGQEGDIWEDGLRSFGDKQTTFIALEKCIDATNEAIGKLKSDTEMGVRDEQGNLIKSGDIGEGIPPKAFISHGKKSVALNKLDEFLRALDVEPLIVKDKPSIDQALPDKVNYYLDQADFVIILATGDDQIEGKLHPRQNVIHEIGLAQKTHPGRIIYLLEEGVEFPSNIRPKVWESFKQRNMMNAFLGIVRELRAYGMLKLIKTPI